MIFLRRTAVGIAAVVCCCAVAPQTSPQPARYRDLAKSYEQSDAAGKQQWLEDLLLRRSDPACRTYMDTQELEQLRKRHRAILSRAAAGRELSTGGIERLLTEVDTQEQRAIQKLEGDYEFGTAQAFHANRAEFEKWNDAWRKIEHHWYAAGQPFEWQPKIIAWLQQTGERQARLQKITPKATPKIVRQPEPPAIRAIPPRVGPIVHQDELQARIVGYNLALSRLVSELHSGESWSTEELSRAAGDLADLATARHDLMLYWDLLPPERRELLPPPESMETAISLLAMRTSQRRKELEVSPATSNARAAWELRRLDDVSRRLATLAASRS